jgi:large conductance mechanosensitive channel
MGMLKEFKEFATKGNVVDLAVGVIIGAAFGGIVSSFIGDIITPILLNPALEAAHVTDMKDLTFMGAKYGMFLSAVLNFIIIAFVLFILIKAMNSMKKAEAPAPDPEPSSTDKLLMEIRDNLKK